MGEKHNKKEIYSKSLMTVWEEKSPSVKLSNAYFCHTKSSRMYITSSIVYLWLISIIYVMHLKAFSYFSVSLNRSAYCALDLIAIHSRWTSAILNRCQFLRDWNKVMCDYFRFEKRNCSVSDVPGETLRVFWGTNRKINDAVTFSGLTYDRVSSLPLSHYLVIYKNT